MQTFMTGKSVPLADNLHIKGQMHRPVIKVQLLQGLHLAGFEAEMQLK